jgi:hypothetical protein
MSFATRVPDGVQVATSAEALPEPVPTWVIATTTPYPI